MNSLHIGSFLFGRITLLVGLLVILTVFSSADLLAKGHDPKKDEEAHIVDLIEEVNEKLAAEGLNVAIERIALHKIEKKDKDKKDAEGGDKKDKKDKDKGEKNDKKDKDKQDKVPRKREFRWVAEDTRRNADGTNLTYLVDQSDGSTASGLTEFQTESAIDQSMNTWNSDSCLKKVEIIKREDNGADPDVLDFFLGLGGLGRLFLADIVFGGWMSRDFFERATGLPDEVFALEVTFIFVEFDDEGRLVPTDINNDHYSDTAMSEIYFNDAFGSTGDPRAGNPWGIDVDLPGLDVTSGALHEGGHALALGHFGPPPKAVMNPVYDGIQQEILPTDHSGMCSLWASWPK